MKRSAVHFPETTQLILESLAAAGGAVLLLGGTDTGKSTLASALARQGLTAGKRVAVVDADVGQSEIGPPTTIGYGIASHLVASLRRIPPRRLYFVGDTSPARRLLPAVIGTALLARAASLDGNELVIVDTTGMVTGPLAAELKFHKIQAVQPGAILAVQQESELEPLLAPFEGAGGPRIVRLSAAPGAHPKSATYRRKRRQQALSDYFADAAPLHLDPARTVWLPHHHGELSQRVCGLLDAQGFALGIGIFLSQNARAITILTPWKDAGQVRSLQTGLLRLSADGQELNRRH